MGCMGHLCLLLQWQGNWNLHWVCINMKRLCPQWFERAHSGCFLVIMGAKRHIHMLCWKRVLIHIEAFVCIEHNWFEIYFYYWLILIYGMPIHTPWIYSMLEMKVASVLTTIWGVSLCFNLQGICFHCSLYCVTNCGWSIIQTHICGGELWIDYMQDVKWVGMKYWSVLDIFCASPCNKSNFFNI